MTFGEREGGLSLWLASQGADVVCTDYNEFPETTQELHKKYGLSEKISYAKEDITQISAPDNTYDIVMFKSVIGGLGSIERQEQAISELYRILKPGGYLLFAENLEATKLHTVVRKKFTNWSGYWCYPKYHQTNKLLDRFSVVEYKSHGFFATFGRSEKQRRILGSIDRSISPIIPGSWKYILFAAAQK